MSDDDFSWFVENIGKPIYFTVLFITSVVVIYFVVSNVFFSRGFPEVDAICYIKHAHTDQLIVTDCPN